MKSGIAPTTPGSSTRPSWPASRRATGCATRSSAWTISRWTSICAPACASRDAGGGRRAYNGPPERQRRREVRAKVSQAVYIVDAARTPFLKARGRPGPFSAADLATACGAQLLARQPFAPDALDGVILGCTSPAADEANIARIAALRMGCGHRMPAWTTQRNCASGLQAID